MFDILVIGKGLMGCGAIRHLTLEHPDLNVGIIGPDEPPNRKTHNGIFASHYDEGRITRILDTSLIWGTLAARSIAQYPLIEQASGIKFHHTVGCLRVTDVDSNIQAVDAVAAHFQPKHSRLAPQATYEHFPYFSFSDDFVAWDEKGHSGYINPRQMILAQLAVAAQNGATIMREIVSDIQEKTDFISVTTREGNRYQARKILITAGGFTNLILSRKLQMKTRAHNILLAELPADEVQRLATMPSLITKFNNQDVPSMYMLPPVKYPDGKIYIKLGSAFREEVAVLAEHFIDVLHNEDDVRAWFQSDGRADIADALKTVLHRLIPNLKVEAYYSHPCLITTTAHDNPYIDVLVPDKIYGTTGGNGSAAKSADEIGRIGAMLTAMNEWQSELEQHEFRAIFVD